MEKRKLGHTELKVSPVMVGGNVFGWTINELESFKLLDAFLDIGFNFIDTANSYSHWVPGNKGGESETIIGNWMKARNNRDQVIIATKVGSAMGRHQGKNNLSEKHIIHEAEESLRRLNTDYIDLYLSHHDDPDTPVSETLEAYQQLVKSGKVRFIGASNFSGERLTESLKTAKRLIYPEYQCIQPRYNLYDREDYEKNMESFVKEKGLGVICYYSLASGFLTGKYRSSADFSKSVRGGSMKKYLNDRGQRILKALDRVASKHQATPASISLAWLMARPGITSPIASATSTTQVEAMRVAAELDLEAADISVLNEASAY